MSVKPTTPAGGVLLLVLGRGSRRDRVGVTNRLREVPRAAEDKPERRWLLEDVNAEVDVAVPAGQLRLHDAPVALGPEALEPHTEATEIEAVVGQVAADDGGGLMRVRDRCGVADRERGRDLV